MKYLVTFGQIHAHDIDGTIFDKDCLAVINATSYEQARSIAFKTFKRKFAFMYDYEKINDPEFMAFYPRGLINLE